jgi:hypothetical protein
MKIAYFTAHLVLPQFPHYLLNSGIFGENIFAHKKSFYFLHKFFPKYSNKNCTRPSNEPPSSQGISEGGGEETTGKILQIEVAVNSLIYCSRIQVHVITNAHKSVSKVPVMLVKFE